MKITLLVVLLGILVACKPKGDMVEETVAQALEAAKTTPNDSTLAVLDQAIIQFIEIKGYQNPDLSKYLRETGELYANNNRTRGALAYYKKHLIYFPDDPNAASQLSSIIAIQEVLNEPVLNQILYKSYVTRFPKEKATADIQAKVTNTEVGIDSTLRQIGQNMFNDSTFRLNEQLARQYVEACELAVMADPTLTNAPEHLHRAAETARTLRDIPAALEIYDWLITIYPDHSRGATALFLKAFTYDNDLKDFERAGKIYQEFLTKHPNNEFAESAKFLFDNLGKSEEELIEILKKPKEGEVQ
jgi:tetratricopeptide (TPR) repeat protein